MNGEKVQFGDRVKIMGKHRNAGYTGKYLGLRPAYFEGELRPWVKLDFDGEEVYIDDPETMLKKV